MPGDFLEKRACENRLLVVNIQCPNCSSDILVRSNMEVEYPIVCSECGHVILAPTDTSSGLSYVGKTIYIKCHKCCRDSEPSADE